MERGLAAGLVSPQQLPPQRYVHKRVCTTFIDMLASWQTSIPFSVAQDAGPNKLGFINQTNPLEILHNPLQAPYSPFINTPKSLPHQASAFPTTTDKRWRTPTTQ